MSQKIIIPKGTIDSTHTTIIEIPSYLHEETTVVVATPKTADPPEEENWEGNEYNPTENSADQREDNWDQEYESPETNEEVEYSAEQQDEYAGYEYATTSEEVENSGETQQHVSYAEEAPPERPTRRPTYEQYNEQMRKRTLERKRELHKLRAERQRLLEGETGLYEAQYLTRENPGDLSEVPESMREKSATREYNLEMEKKRRQQEFERQSLPHFSHPGYQPGYSRGQRSVKYAPETQNQRYAYSARPEDQQWNPNTHGYPDMQYAPQGHFRHQTAMGHPKRLGQMDYGREDVRQLQRGRRRTTFEVPNN